ncbi:MAG: septation regulator SpoVG [Bacillota bacterium]
MQITDVRLRLIEAEGKLKAVGSITIDSEFVVHDLRVVEGPTGLFVSMPSRRTASGEYRDVAHPITSGNREMIRQSVLAAYYEKMNAAATVAER